MGEGLRAYRMPNDAWSNEGGRFVQKYSDEESLETIRAEGSETRTFEIAKRVDYSKNTTHKRLYTLADKGWVGHRKVAGVNLWSVADGR